MKTIAQLEAEAAEILSKAQGLRDKAKAEDRPATEEEETEFDSLLASHDSIKSEIEKRKKDNDRAAQLSARVQAASQPSPRIAPPNSTGTHVEAASVTVLGHASRHDTQRNGFLHFGEFASAVYAANPNVGRGIDERLNMAAAATGMSQGSGPDGGYTVPPEFSTAIWDGMNEAPDNMLSACDTYTVTGESLTFNANAETSRVTGSRYGGVQGYWLAEADQMTASKPKFRQLKLEPQQLGVLIYVTDKLLKNSQVALAQYLLRAASDEINFLTGDSIFNGTGAGQPLGVVGHSGTVSVAKETNQAAATIVADNIHNMWTRMPAKWRSGANWYINQDCEPQLEKLSAVVGTGGIPVYLPPGGITETPNARLKGRPVIPIEYCQTCGTVGDIVFANLKAYAVGLRGSIDTAMSIHLRFDYNETAFRFLFEVDGQPWLNSPITPAKGSSTRSPIVTLATRS